MDNSKPPSTSLNPSAASFSLSKSFATGEPTTSSAPYRLLEDAIKTSSVHDSPPTSSSSDLPRTSSVSSTTSVSSEENKVKSFGGDWLSAPFEAYPKAESVSVQFGHSSYAPPSINDQILAHENLAVLPHPQRLPAPAPTLPRRTRSPSLPILPSELSTPKASGLLPDGQYPSRYLAQHRVDEASRRHLFKLLEGAASSPRPHDHGHHHHPESGDSTTWSEISRAFEDNTPDNLNNHLASLSLGSDHPVTQEDSRYVQVRLPPHTAYHHTMLNNAPQLLHHVSTPNIPLSHRRSIGQVRFQLPREDEEDERQEFELERLTRKSSSSLTHVSAGRNVYIHSVPADYTETSLTEYASRFGKAVQARCKPVGEPRDNVPVRHCGFVLFEQREEAEAFLRALQSRGITSAFGKDDYQLEHKAREDRESSNLYINGLPLTTTEEQLKRLLAPYGTVASFKFLTDNEGIRRGPCMARLLSRPQADAAVQALNNVSIGSGRVLQVRIADSKDQKELKRDTATTKNLDSRSTIDVRMRQDSMPTSASILFPEELERKQRALQDLAEINSIEAHRSKHVTRSFPAYLQERTPAPRGITFPGSSAAPAVLFSDQHPARHRHLSSNISTCSALSHEFCSTPNSSNWTSRSGVSNNPYQYSLPQTSTSVETSRYKDMEASLASSQSFSKRSSYDALLQTDQSWHGGVWSRVHSTMQHKRDVRDIWKRDEHSAQSHQMHHVRSSSELSQAISAIPSSLWSEMDGQESLSGDHQHANQAHHVKA